LRGKASGLSHSVSTGAAPRAASRARFAIRCGRSWRAECCARPDVRRPRRKPQDYPAPGRGDLPCGPAPPLRELRQRRGVSKMSDQLQDQPKRSWKGMWRRLGSIDGYPSSMVLVDSHDPDCIGIETFEIPLCYGRLVNRRRRCTDATVAAVCWHHTPLGERLECPNGCSASPLLCPITCSSSLAFPLKVAAVAKAQVLLML
jgi:hypothetical protein